MELRLEEQKKEEKKYSEAQTEQNMSFGADGDIYITRKVGWNLSLSCKSMPSL